MSDAWSALLGVLVGGGISLAAQWFLGPRVERRMRAQERWEHQLLELRHFVGLTLAEVRKRARMQWNIWLMLHEVYADIDPPTTLSQRQEQRIEEQKIVVDKVLREWHETLSGHPDWLVKRIVRQARSHTEVKLDIAWMYYQITVPYDPMFKHSPATEELIPKWDREEERYKALLAEVDRLVDDAFARPRSLWNLSWHARSWVSRQIKRLGQRLHAADEPTLRRPPDH